MDVFIEGIVCGIPPVKKGVSKMGIDWVQQTILIKKRDGSTEGFNIFGEDKICAYDLNVGDRICASCTFETKIAEDGKTIYPSLKLNTCYKDARIKNKPPKRNDYDNLPL